MTDQPSGLLLDCLGFLACGLVLCTFAMTSMRALRLVAMASNLGFIPYAWPMGLWPILAPHTVLLPLDAVRAWSGWSGGAGRRGIQRPPGSPRSARLVTTSMYSVVLAQDGAGAGSGRTGSADGRRAVRVRRSAASGGHQDNPAFPPRGVPPVRG